MAPDPTYDVAGLEPLENARRVAQDPKSGLILVLKADGMSTAMAVSEPAPQRHASE